MCLLFSYMYALYTTLKPRFLLLPQGCHVSQIKQIQPSKRKNDSLKENHPEQLFQDLSSLLLREEWESSELYKKPEISQNKIRACLPFFGTGESLKTAQKLPRITQSESHANALTMELDHFRHFQQTGEEREMPFKTPLPRQSLIMKPDSLEYSPCKRTYVLSFLPPPVKPSSSAGPQQGHLGNSGTT